MMECSTSQKCLSSKNYDEVEENYEHMANDDSESVILEDKEAEEDEEELKENDKEIGEYEEDMDDEDEEIEVLEEEDDEPDFMDNFGKQWNFVCRIRNEPHLKEWCCQQLGGMIEYDEEKRKDEKCRRFKCAKKFCQFRALFFQSMSLLYSRKKHNHSMKTTKENEKIAAKEIVNQHGQKYKLYGRISKNGIMENFRKNFGFNTISESKYRINLLCQKCEYKGIYLRKSGCLYTHGQHQCAKKLMKRTSSTEIEHHFTSIISKGLEWNFYAQIEKNLPIGTIKKRFGFRFFRRNAEGFILRCNVVTKKHGKCYFQALYVNDNGCLYANGKHNHVVEISAEEMGIQLQQQSSEEINQCNIGHVKWTEEKTDESDIPLLIIEDEEEEGNQGQEAEEKEKCLEEYEEKKEHLEVDEEEEEHLEEDKEEEGNLENEDQQHLDLEGENIGQQQNLDENEEKEGQLEDEGRQYLEEDEKEQGNLEEDEEKEGYFKEDEEGHFEEDEEDEGQQHLEEDEEKEGNLEENEEKEGHLKEEEEKEGNFDEDEEKEKNLEDEEKEGHLEEYEEQHHLEEDDEQQNLEEYENPRQHLEDEEQQYHFEENEDQQQYLEEDEEKERNLEEEGRQQILEEDERQQHHLEQNEDQQQYLEENEGHQDLEEDEELLEPILNVEGHLEEQQNILEQMDVEEMELEIIAEVNLGKWLPKIKKESENRSTELPLLTVDDPDADERLRQFMFRPKWNPRPVKKEEPNDDMEIEQQQLNDNANAPNLNIPAGNNQPILAREEARLQINLPIEPPRPTKMLLRERKRNIVYRV